MQRYVQMILLLVSRIINHFADMLLLPALKNCLQIVRSDSYRSVLRRLYQKSMTMLFKKMVYE